MSTIMTKFLTGARCFRATAFAAVACFAAAPLPAATATGAANRVTARAFRVERPTLENLGFEWGISGDANRNAAVTISYRRKGDSAWKQGLPLLRLNGEEVISRNFKPAFTYVAPNMFAGSLFDLQPDTNYEVQLTLSDPDGVTGPRRKAVIVHTRPEPRPAQDGHEYHVYPFGHSGPKQEPGFSGLLGAYYQGSVGGDWYNAFPARVQPGDVILVHAGLYKDDRFRYGHELMSRYTECCNTTGDGTYYLTAKGTPDRPIVIKAAGDGEVIFDGDHNYNLFNVQAADYNYFEGLTFRNTEIVFEAGIKRIAGATGLTVKRSKFEDIGVGVHSDWAGSRDFYVADNEFTGRHNPAVLTSWGPTGPWASQPGFHENSRLQSQFAVKVYGSGHVIAYNRVRNFHDGIDHATYGNAEQYPDTPPDLEPSSIDIYNNDISNVHDNCIEADGAMHNIRVLRNRCVNSGSEGFSLQPLLGGPAYFVRNVLYNSPFAGGIKLSEFPAGGVFFHNTWLVAFAPGENSVGSNMQLRNNLFLRQSQRLPVLQLTTFTNYSSSDYNGFYAGKGNGAFMWNSPPTSVAMDTAKTPEKRGFETLERYSAGTGQDRHSVMIDASVFQILQPVPESASPGTVFDPAKIDVRLAPASAAIDSGVPLPGINDHFSGTAPDLGAVEAGAPLPRYGPR
jgi:hypothetical protein